MVGSGVRNADRRCNIFEALLIRHFRSSEDFEKMVMREKMKI